MIDTEKEREAFEAWHVEYCSRKPRLDALPGLCEDDKKAWAAWQARAAMVDEDVLAALLPGPYYMDPPDGGDTPILEQLRRMSKDAERYRLIRRKVGIVGSEFCVLNLNPRYVAPDPAIELDASIDAAMAAQRGGETRKRGCGVADGRRIEMALLRDRA